MATTDSTPSTSFLDPGRVVTTAANLASKGLIGDVVLRSRPVGAHISDVFAQTSTRKNELKLDVELNDVPACPLQFTALLVDEKVREEKRFQGKAEADGSKRQVIQLAWTWNNPRLWDVQQPNLYTIKLEAKGASWADEYTQTFGFREFWSEGPKFYLNGKEIRLRPNAHNYTETCFGGSVELTDAHIDGCLYAGFNMEECWPVNHDEKGSVNFRELWADRADRKGFLLMGAALPIEGGKWSKAEYQATHSRKLEREMRRYRNHPSIVIWTTNPNWLGNGLDQDPRYIGRTESKAIITALEDWKKTAAKGAVAAIKKLDPTRLVLNHAGAYNGDIYNINCYLNLIPLQEREEWLSEWAKTGGAGSGGDMPLMCCEFGTPWKNSFLLGRWGFEGSTEPLMTEYCAIYLGAQAYALETADYRRAIAKQSKDMGANWNTIIDASPAFEQLQALFNRNTYRSWRTWGISGGMIPWDYGYGWDAFDNERRRKNLPVGEQDLRPFTPGMRGTARDKTVVSLIKPFQPGGMDVYPAGIALMAANGPTLAWIAGAKEAFTSKDHNFGVGQDVDKQIALLNDERTPQDYGYTWTAELDGKQFAGDSGKGSIEPARTLFVPLHCHVPELTDMTKATGTITLTARIGNREHKDVFSFRVFSKPTPLQQTVTLYDPVGKTAQMLAALGCKVQEWNGKPSSDLIVVGREALSSGKALPGDLEAIVAGGGRVLVFTQSPDWLRTALGFRVAPHLSRRVFPVSAAHPVCQGLEAADLSDWAGESTLVEAYPKYTVENPGWRSPTHGWHWGNRGAVTSAAIEKPHRSGWRPIFECEFDLAYSPLMELDYGQGRLLLCTLDLEDHASLDSAAALLARSLIQYAAATRPIARAKRTILVGDDNDSKTLDALGVVYQTAASLEQDADLIVLGGWAKCDEAEVQSYLAKGRKALFLPRSTPDYVCGVKLGQVQAFAGSLTIPAWPECQGLSPSDLHWRAEHPAWLVESGADKGAEGLLGVLHKGTGVAVFCQIDPERFQVEQKQYFRITRWRQTRALAQILANLGASFATDRDVFPLAAKAGKKGSSGLYHADYREEFKNGDDPYRYFRW